MIATIEKGLTPNDAKTPGQDPLMAGGKDPNPIENQQYAFSHFGDLIDVRIDVCPFRIRLGHSSHYVERANEVDFILRFVRGRLKSMRGRSGPFS